jgi:hypothetical protein
VDINASVRRHHNRERERTVPGTSRNKINKRGRLFSPIRYTGNRERNAKATSAVAFSFCSSLADVLALLTPLNDE